ncbi:MAG: ribonuclease D [Proteobacteria bacterium]|nr:ribonuclease D [Pseudomonadota bacterium]
MSKNIHLHQADLPASLDLGGLVAIDTESMGLNPQRDRLCLVQLSAGDGTAHLVQIAQNATPPPRLAALLADPQVEKIFHFARADLAMLSRWIGEVAPPIFCTKIASKLARTYTDRHGLSDLIADLLAIPLKKEQQSSDWGAAKLTPPQLQYAANDVLYLHQLRAHLTAILTREDRLAHAQACFAFLPTRARLDLAGFPATDIFAHH